MSITRPARDHRLGGAFASVLVSLVSCGAGGASSDGGPRPPPVVAVGHVAPPCHASAIGGTNTGQPRLPPEVFILTSDDMHAWCNMVDGDGRPVDPEGMCQDFRDPPSEVIATFEARLPALLSARGHSSVAQALRNYVRQYWAVFRDGRLIIVGNFVCRSTVDTFHLDETAGDVKPAPEQELAHIPFTVDDAGTCNITASFPADRPDDVRF
jgi:hypothetical protein